MSTLNQIQDWINDLGQCNSEESIKNWVGRFPGKIADTTMDAYKGIIMYDIPSVDKYINNILEDGVPADSKSLVSAIYAGLMADKYQDPKDENVSDERESQVNDVIENKENAELTDNVDTLQTVEDINKSIEDNVEEVNPTEDVIEKRNEDPVVDKLIVKTSEIETPAEHPSEDDITKNMKKIEGDIQEDEKNFGDDPYAPTEQGIIRRLQKPIENFMGKAYNFMRDPDFKPIISSIAALGYAGIQYVNFVKNAFEELNKQSMKTVFKSASHLFSNKEKVMKLLLWCAKNWKMIAATAAVTASLPALYTAIGRLMSKDPAFGQNKEYAEFVAREYAKLYPAKYKQYTQYRFSELNTTVTEKNLTKMVFNFSMEDIVYDKLMNNKNFSDDELITMLTRSGFDLTDALIKKAYLLKLLNDPFFRERMATYIFSDMPEDMKVIIMDDPKNFSTLSNAISGVAKSDTPSTPELLRRLTDIAEANEAANYTDTVTRAVKVNKK